MLVVIPFKANAKQTDTHDSEGCFTPHPAACCSAATLGSLWGIHGVPDPQRCRCSGAPLLVQFCTSSVLALFPTRLILLLSSFPCGHRRHAPLPRLRLMWGYGSGRSCHGSARNSLPCLACIFLCGHRSLSMISVMLLDVLLWGVTNSLLKHYSRGMTRCFLCDDRST